MRIHKLIFSSLLLVLIFLQGIAQKSLVIDSLKKELEKVETDSIKVDILNKLAWEWLTNDPVKSEQYLNKVYQLTTRINYQVGLGEYYHYKGLLSYYAGNVTEALEYFFESYDVRKKADDVRGLASACRVIGVMFADQKLNEKALDYYYQSYDLSKLITDTTGMAGALNNIGVVFWETQKTEKAIENFEKALELVQNSTDYTSIGMYTNNIANIYRDEGNYDKAFEYYMESKRYKELGGDYVYLTTVYSDLAKFYNLTGNPEEALQYIAKSKKLAEKAGLLHELKDVEESYSASYKLLGDFEKALHHYTNFKLLNDSIKNEEIASHLTKLEMNLQFAKEKEIEKLRQEKKDLENQRELSKHKAMRNIVIIILIASVMLAFFLYRIIQYKKRDNLVLQQQKSEILEKNEELQVHQDEILKQNIEISDHRKALVDSINYARQIQHALLPSTEIFKTYFDDSFLFYLPKEIISGDFYWIRKRNEKLFFALADCTGHGVPGALMSMLGISFLNEIVSKNNISEPHFVLEELRTLIKTSLKQTGRISETRDGMDIAFCIYDHHKKVLQYSGANHPIYLFHQHQLIELEPTDNPIGIYIKETEFKSTTIDLRKGDIIYLFTDGIVDQVGGDQKKKFLTPRFKELLQQIHNRPMDEQKKIIEERFYAWKNDKKQVDDVTVMGIQI